jgi:anti-sigma factor RsiW
VTGCDGVREARLLGRAPDRAAAAHLAACPACRAEAAALERLAAAFAGAAPPSPGPALGAAVLRRAEPLLARHARRAAWTAVARAVAAALVPLPLVLLLDAWLVSTAHTLLSRVLPAALSLWVVGNYAVLLAFLLAITYIAVPILAARQVRPGFEESHA